MNFSDLDSGFRRNDEQNGKAATPAKAGVHEKNIETDRIMRTAVLSMICFLFFSWGSNAGAKNDLWISFMDNPNETNYYECKKLINEYLAKKKNNIKNENYKGLGSIGNYQLFQKFLKMVSKKNDYAIRLGFQMFHLTGGATAEDLSVELGKLIKTDPEKFLIYLKSYNNIMSLDNHKKGVLLGNLGEEYVDNFNGQEAELNRRFESLKRVNDRYVIAERDVCMGIISEQIAHIKRIKKELKQFPFSLGGES